MNYLSYAFKDNKTTVSTFDEMPLWSASFGLLLLKHVALKPNLTVLDIGSAQDFLYWNWQNDWVNDDVIHVMPTSRRSLAPGSWSRSGSASAFPRSAG